MAGRFNIAADKAGGAITLIPPPNAGAIATVAEQIHPNRLSVAWLNGSYLDRGTLSLRNAGRPLREAVRVPALPA